MCVKNKVFKMSCFKSISYFFIMVVLIFFTASNALSLQPPRIGEIEKLKQNGEYEERLEFAEKLGNHKVDPLLIKRLRMRLKGELPAPPSSWRGLPTKGDVKVLALLIDFSDTPHVNSKDTVNSKLFGNANASEYPRESLINYYKRSSYNQLNISGSTLGWYTTPYPRSSVQEDGAGLEDLVMEALNYFDAQGHDFTQYDNDGDGDIDYIMIFWSGADTGWSGFWWGYQSSWYINSNYTIDGKRLSQYSWQWESTDGTEFDPSTVIHETGHALGLPDYYDYDDTVGPDGGVGGLDMMDWGGGDHNCFSKWLLEWITPSIVSSGSETKTLRSSGTYKDAVVIMPNANNQNAFYEYFIVQNRYRTGNDDSGSWIHSDGILIWHVDARLNDTGDDYMYDNSYTDHKLLKLMEADGFEEIEAGAEANAGDYYVNGASFSSTTFPSSIKYDGTSSNVNITNFSVVAESMTALFSIDGTVSVPSVSTNNATLINKNSAVLNGTINPNSASTTYYFEYGTTTSYGSKTTTQSAGSGKESLSVSADLTGLTPNTTYHFRLAAANSAGTTNGSDQTFKTNIDTIDLPNSITSYKILTNQSNSWTVQAGEYPKIFGASGGSNITIKSGGRAECVNFAGSNVITIEDNYSDFTVYRSGATVYFESAAKGTKIKIPATKTGQTLKFNNGSSTLTLVINSNNKVMLGSQEIGLKN